MKTKHEHQRIVPSMELLSEMEALVIRGGTIALPQGGNNCNCTKTQCDCIGDGCHPTVGSGNGCQTQ